MRDPIFEFSWARCDASGSCTSIPHATGPSYVVTAADGQHRIELRVVARNEYGETEARVQTAHTVPHPEPVLPPPAAASDKKSGAGASATKLALARATISRHDRVLDVLAPITRLASGRVHVQLQAGKRRYRFTAPIDSATGRVRFRRQIPKTQAELGTGIVTITYPGDADTRPQTVRLRAASRPAKLTVARPTITAGGRLRAAGTVSARAGGAVRLQLGYVADGKTMSLQLKAPILNGRWNLDVQLPQVVRGAMARREGAVQSYTLFTGYLQERMRGEMRSYQVGFDPTG